MTRAGALLGVWLPRSSLFAASVDVCVPVLESAADQPTSVRRWTGAEAEIVAEPTEATVVEATWAPLVGDLRGVPAVHLDPASRVGDVAAATAGFRDQFYGLQPFVRSAEDQAVDAPRLVTSGAIDPVHDLWARRSTKFAGERFDRPVVELSRLQADAPALARWAEPLLVPKLLVATQTRVVEVVVDVVGDRWPSVPVIAVTAPVDDLWWLAAALSSPAVSAWCLQRHAGAALSGDAIKLSAKQVLDVPLPPPAGRVAWASGVEELRSAAAAAGRGDGEGWRAALAAFGRTMDRAYGVGPDVATWWHARLPPFR